MANAIAEPENREAPPWALALGFHRPVFGPIVIAIAGLLLFHVVVALTRPEYWLREPAWDEGFYVQIARTGYALPDGDYGRYNDLPFSPGYPMLLRAVSAVTRLDPQVLRLPVSALLFAAGCAALGWVLRAFSRDHVRNNLVVLFAALWPGSLYFCTGYAEALYWPLLLLCIGCMLRRRWFAAAWLAAACWFTRTPAVVVVGTLAAAIVMDAFAARTRTALLQGARRLCWALPIAGLGLLAYMLMTRSAAGDWFAFRKAYVAWQPCEMLTQRSMTFRTIGDALLLFRDRPTLKIAVAWFLAAPVLVCARRRSMPALLTVFTAGVWLFFLANDWQLEPYHDTLRWLSVAFPLHWAVVDLLVRRSRWQRFALGGCWLLASASVYVWCVRLFVTRQWVS